MRKTIFYFICVFFISLALYPIFQNTSSESSNRILVTAILLLGIPHGAIDNILMKRRTGWNSARFYFFYLSLISLNALLWFIYPAVSLLIFLLISAYHFGQAQLSHNLKRETKSKQWSYLFWGNLVLASFFYFNSEEILSYFTDFPASENILLLFNKEFLFTFMLFNLLGLAICFYDFYRKELLDAQSLIIECITLILIMAIALLFHFIFGFTIFFIFLHAFPVLVQEYEELYSSKKWDHLPSFLKLLSPYSILSLIGIFGLLYLKEIELIDLSYLYLILIAISSITLPHAWVMQKFYKD